MYSRYSGIDREDHFAPAAEAALSFFGRPEPKRSEKPAARNAGGFLHGPFTGLNPFGSLRGLFKGFDLKSFDMGDILLLVILFLLFMEGEEDGGDWLIIIALVVLLGI